MNEIKLTYEPGLSDITANVFEPDGTSREADIAVSDDDHPGLYLGDCATIQPKDPIIFFHNGVYLGGDTYKPTAVTVISTRAKLQMVSAIQGTTQSGLDVGHDIRMGQTEVDDGNIVVIGRREAIEQENVTPLIDIGGRI